MNSLNPAHIEDVIKLINEGPFFRYLSMVVTELGPGYSKVKMQINNNHLNPFGGLHGGAFASVLDTAAYWSAYCDMPEESGLVTIDIKVDYLAPSDDSTLIAEGNCLKAGKTLVLTESVLKDSKNRKLAHTTSKLMVTEKQQSIKTAVDFLKGSTLPPKFLRRQHAV